MLTGMGFGREHMGLLRYTRARKRLVLDGELDTVLCNADPAMGGLKLGWWGTWEHPFHRVPSCFVVWCTLPRRDEALEKGRLDISLDMDPGSKDTHEGISNAGTPVEEAL